METIDKVVAALGAADIDARLEEQLVDGILYAFQEQVRGARGARGGLWSRRRSASRQHLQPPCDWHGFLTCTPTIDKHPKPTRPTPPRPATTPT